jgi:hypothetical protein
MTEVDVVSLIREALFIAIKISAPILITALIVGGEISTVVLGRINLVIMLCRWRTAHAITEGFPIDITRRLELGLFQNRCCNL